MQHLVQLDRAFVGQTLHGTPCSSAAEIGDLSARTRFWQRRSRWCRHPPSRTLTLVPAVTNKPASIVQRSPRGIPKPAFAPIKHSLPTEITMSPPPDNVPMVGASRPPRSEPSPTQTPCRYAAFDHPRAFGTRIEVNEAFMHDGGALTQIGSQAGLWRCAQCERQPGRHSWSSSGIYRRWKLRGLSL